MIPLVTHLPRASSQQSSALRHSCRRLCSILALAAMITTNVSAATWSTTGAVITHDPSLTKEGSTWWIFETAPGVGVKYSGNGLAWTQGVKLFASKPSWWATYVPGQNGTDVWAPDVRKFGSRTYCYYSISTFGSNTSAIGLTSCSSIAAGDWRDDGLVISSKSGTTAYNAIDPNLVVDASGAPWLVFGSWFSGIQIVKLNTSTMKPTGAITKLAARSGGIEGACIAYTGGYYYLFVSIDKCCNGVSSTYKIAYGRSTSITGPYVTKTGATMLSGATSLLDSGNTRWKGPGGQSVYKNGSAWVIARHAYDANNNGAPTLLISDLFFSGGWPTY